MDKSIFASIHSSDPKNADGESEINYPGYARSTIHESLTDGMAEAYGAEIFEMLVRVFEETGPQIPTDLHEACKKLIKEVTEENARVLADLRSR